MRRSIRQLLDTYRRLGIEKGERGNIPRYSDKYRREKDGTVNIIGEIHSRSEEYPNELVEGGFGHGKKYKAGKSAEELVFTTKIDSEVEESEETEEKNDSENEEMDNDYIENYYDTENDDTEDENEDVI